MCWKLRRPGMRSAEDNCGSEHFIDTLHGLIMDDQRTYRELEELAAMYLRSPEQVDDADMTPMALSQPYVEDSPEPGASHDPGPGPALSGEPALRLAGKQPPRVEAVFVGNLPGFASAWLTQYADELSASVGPVAIAHVEPGLVELELLQPNPDRKPADQVRPPTRGERGPSELETTLEELAGQVNAWLIHLREPAANGAADVLAMADCWTLISGADKPALVAGYRLIKQLAAMTGSPEDRPASMQMMFMGCDQAAADQARDQLTAATEQFLNLPTAYLGHRQKMQPAAKQFVGAFDESSGQPLPVLIEFINDLGQAIDRDPTATTETAPTPTNDPAAQPFKDWLDQEIDRLFEAGHNQLQDRSDQADPVTGDWPDGPVCDDLDPQRVESQHQPAVDDAQPATDAPSSDEPTDSVSPANGADPSRCDQDIAEAAESPTGEPAQPDDDGEPAELDLTEYVLGVVELAAHCPSEPAAQLALDSSGRLHLLLDARGTQAQPALMRLGALSRWAFEHASLLALTCDEMTYDTGASPICHLFTDKPRDYARWAHAGPGGIADLHLHLLCEVVVGPSRTLHHVPVT